jgi:hypothetical protein
MLPKSIPRGVTLKGDRVISLALSSPAGYLLSPVLASGALAASPGGCTVPASSGRSAPATGGGVGAFTGSASFIAGVQAAVKTRMKRQKIFRLTLRIITSSLMFYNLSNPIKRDKENIFSPNGLTSRDDPIYCPPLETAGADDYSTNKVFRPPTDVLLVKKRGRTAGRDNHDGS